MTTFKRKPKKVTKACDIKYITTLDTEHSKFVADLTKNRDGLDNLREALRSAEEELKSYETMNNADITYEIIYKKNAIKDSIADLNIKIRNIENRVDEIDYYDKTTDILINYYDDTGASSEGNSFKNINDIFNQTKSNSNNKANLLDTYRSAIDDTYVGKDKKYNIIRYCKACGYEKVINYQEGLFECTHCGNCDIVVIESDKPNYKEHVPDTSNTAYKRINHFWVINSTSTLTRIDNLHYCLNRQSVIIVY